MKRKVAISIFCLYEWWQTYFYSRYPMPEIPSDAALEKLYLQRQKFLYELYGEFGIGSPNPQANGEYLNHIKLYGLDFVPAAMGVPVCVSAGGGYAAKQLSDEEVDALKPIKFEDSAEAEWILRRAEKLKARYGSAVFAIEIHGPINSAHHIRGQEFFLDMYDEEERAHHLLEMVTQANMSIYKFQAKEFGLGGYTIANCVASAMLSPSQYVEFGLPYDKRLAEMSMELTGNPRAVRMHHCDSLIDNVAPHYATISQLREVEARTTSNFDIIRSVLPNVTLSGMVNAIALATKETKALMREDIEPALREDITTSLNMWSFGPETTPEHLKEILSGIRELCKVYDVEPVFSMIPFDWIELEWALPCWEGYLDNWKKNLGD